MHGRQSGSGSRRGFTLVEMLVSLAVVSVALVVVVSAFRVATQTARQAAAFSEISAVARQWQTQFEEDLRNVDPSSSMLVIVGGTQAAGVGPDQVAARRFTRVLMGDPARVPRNYDPVRAPQADSQYSDPRTDILAFFTRRATTSQAPLPPYVQLNLNNRVEAQQAAYRDGARGSPLLVTYGHAALGDLGLATSGQLWAGTLRHIFTNPPTAISPIPARDWHLSRRALLIDPPPTLTSASTFPFDPGLNSQNVYERLQLALPDVGAKRAGDAVTFDLTGFLRDPRFDPRFSPYRGVGGTRAPALPNAAIDLVDRLLYPAGSEGARHIATVIGQPPPELATNSAVHLAPGCAWFHVEFLMPEDPRNALDHPDINTRAENLRWVSVPPGRTFVFVPDSSENRALIASTPIANGRLGDFGEVTPEVPNNPLDDVTDRRIRTWPYALRVTIRLYDPRGRLEEPIVRSIVHRFD
ncbi:MAG: prepilin-type N-terminal cleavage/methylation domain-containing protein [Phycisphaerales bacterium]|nr:prepilin-type N-terminal cleavage/methylation domain-containing protein [Phycisphaerales bacterium]